MKRWLAARPRPATVEGLQALLDAFVEHYNLRRPHRSLPGSSTPDTAYRARPKAAPGQRSDTHDRVRHDVVDKSGRVTLRISGRLHHIGLGQALTGTRVLVLVHDLDVRVVDQATGELLRALTVDPTRDYQPTGQPPGPKPHRRGAI